MKPYIVTYYEHFNHSTDQFATFEEAIAFLTKGYVSNSIRPTSLVGPGTSLTGLTLYKALEQE